MFVPDAYMTSDADEASFEGSLKSLDISFAVPEPTDNADTAASWVKSPELMLKTLTEELNGILSICEARHFDGLVIQIKHEFLTADGNSDSLELVVIALFLGHYEKCLDLVNCIQLTPFSGDVIRNLKRVIYKGNTIEFDLAINGWKKALQQLADWGQVRHLLNGESGAKKDENRGLSHEVDEAQKILSQDPRTEIIRQIMIEHADWVSGKRDMILQEVAVRYVHPETRRCGIGRTLGLQIIRRIENGEI